MTLKDPDARRLYNRDYERRNQRRRAYRTEKQRIYAARDRRDPNTWGKTRIHHIRKRCRENKIPFNLEISDLIVPKECPVFKIPFVFGDLPHPASPTVDRRIPALGYVKGNVNIISRRANTIKSDCLTGDELRRVADWIDNLV